MIHHFDHRFATIDGVDAWRALPDTERSNPLFEPLSRYWITAEEARRRINVKWRRDWVVGFRNICRSTDVRSVIAAAVPIGAIPNNMPLALPIDRSPLLFPAVLSSLVFDYALRQKLGGTTLNFFYLEQAPCVGPDQIGHFEFCGWEPRSAFLSRILELTYTSWGMRPFANDAGDSGPPFVWCDARRAVLRAEVDAAMFLVYGIHDRSDVEFIMGTFSVMNERDEREFGEERSRRLVLENYDAMARAIETGQPFVSTLDPPPGRGPRHPAREDVPA